MVELVGFTVNFKTYCWTIEELKINSYLENFATRLLIHLFTSKSKVMAQKLSPLLMFNNVIADCFAFSSFYFFPVYFLGFSLGLLVLARGENVTHFRRNAPTKKKKKKNRTDWAGSEIFDRELDLSHVKLQVKRN